LSSPFLGPEPSISISPSVGRLKVKEWLMERYYHCHCHARHKAVKALHWKALDRKQFRLVTGLLNGHYT
jgi:hypothetical protein